MRGLITAAAMLVAGAAAAQETHPAAEAQALELAKTAITYRSVRGPDNKTLQLMAYWKQVLTRAGFDPAEIGITPVDDTAYFIATWKGSDPSLKPFVISGHLDVVEAKPADWQRDPFTPVVENGYLFGRGATDMKFDAALATAALIELKREGYTPRRSIVLQFSGDEETTMKTSALIAEKLKNADVVINIDGGGGVLDEANGKPVFWTWSGAEKTYADFELTVTDPGGHSSAPRAVNAIVRMSQALEKIGAYHFKPEVNDLTRQSFTAAAKYEDAETAAAMTAFAADPGDAKAAATLRANPALVGQIGTTCVPTMVTGGHALNALPQKVTANINCRIFPGHPLPAIMAELEQAVGDPGVVFKDVTEGSVATAPSPMRADFLAAVRDAMTKVYPGVPVFPSMSAGASDSMWYRHVGVDSYGASPMFIKDSDNFSHGLNERTPIANVRPSITYYLSLYRSLTK